MPTIAAVPVMATAQLTSPELVTCMMNASELPPLVNVVEPNATLPWNDVNILIVTDVHSWIAGHPHPDHEPLLDGNYGHVLSLHERLTATAARTFHPADLRVRSAGAPAAMSAARKPPRCMSKLSSAAREWVSVLMGGRESAVA